MRHLRPVEDPVVAASFQTLADLRAAIDRWRGSRVEIGAEVEQLELQEAQLASELTQVRERLATLRSVRDDLVAAAGHLATASDAR